jgi:LemA protein
MHRSRNRLLAILLMPVVLFLAACGVNSIPTAEENAKAKWANVQAAYQRRMDSLPSLAQTVTAAAGHERNLQTSVAEARSGVQQAQITPEQLTDPAAVQRYQAAQTNVTAMIGRWLQEVPPENRANQNYRDLQEQIEGANNRINIAMLDYNEAVRAYNTEIRTFPSVIGARVIYGSQPMVPFEAQQGAAQAPDLTNSLK